MIPRRGIAVSCGRCVADTGPVRTMEWQALRDAKNMRRYGHWTGPRPE